jgi:Flp pilus assembly secretin CpaC/tetratricopeptide (TPR) repeat protein
MITVQTLRLRGLVASSLLALAACSGTPSQPDQPSAEPSNGSSNGQPMAQPKVGSQDPVPESQRRGVLLARALENGKQFLAIGQYEQARSEALFALELDPKSGEARELLAKCQAVLADAPLTSPQGRLDQAVMLDKIRAERERAIVENELQLGRANLQQGNFGRAVDHFERAAIALRFSPYTQPNDPKRKEVEAELASAQDAKAKAEIERLDRAKIASERELAQLEAEQQVARSLRVERMLEQANLSFQAGQYDQSLKLVDQALMLDPTNPTATALRDLADRARHNTAVDNSRERFRIEWNKTFLELQHSNLPQTETVQFNPERWAMVSQREPASFTQTTNLETPENQAVWQRLQETAFEHNFPSGTAVADWAAYYAERTGVTFLVEDEVRALPAEQTTLSDFHLPRKPVAEALRNIQAQTGVAFRVRDGMVRLAASTGTPDGPYFVHKIHVNDLVKGYRDRPGPQLTLPIPGVDVPLFPEADENVPPPVVDEGKLQELLKGMIAQDKWDGNPFTMNIQAGVMFVYANSDTHRQVDQVVEQLRKHVGIQIDVESRFLKVEDSFLEDVGIDLRGLGDQSSQGLAGRGLEKNGLRPNAGFDDFGPKVQQNASVPGLVGTGTSPGVFFDNGRDGDYMARIENLYNGTLGGRRDGLSNAGGLALQYAFLDDTEVELVLRAVAKQERSEQVDAPRLLVFNNVQASMHHLHNIAYIRDFDVEIAQNAAVANPVVGVVHEGVTLDVKPVVDADLKFITMELRPTVMTLQLPIPTFTTTLGVGQPISIQIPEVNLQKVRTTVTLPDGGTMMLGGMRLVERQNMRSSVPLIGSLPGLSWLFSRKGTSVQNRKILILIKARIILMDEWEPATVVGPDGRIVSSK